MARWIIAIEDPQEDWDRLYREIAEFIMSGPEPGKSAPPSGPYLPWMQFMEG